MTFEKIQTKMIREEEYNKLSDVSERIRSIHSNRKRMKSLLKDMVSDADGIKKHVNSSSINEIEKILRQIDMDLFNLKTKMDNSFVRDLDDWCKSLES